MNNKNLRTPSTEIAREMQKKSVQKRAENKRDRLIFSKAIQERMTDEQYLTIIDNAIKRAMKSDKGFEILRDTLGQRSRRSVDISSSEPFEIIVETLRE